MEVFGIVGNPVGHSLSPPMHEAAYDALGMDARYVTFEPAPGDLGVAVRGADALGVRGLNVTIPYKEDILEYVEPRGLADRIGAVNTIDFASGRASEGSEEGAQLPAGYNTDAAGARRALEEHDVSLEGVAVVVGAGGAGRAIAFGLAEAGLTVRIANRTVERAEALAGEIQGASSHPLAALPELVARADLLVNATSVGMEEDASPVPADALHADLAVLDAVYQPIETRLLRDAAAAGATTVDGAWMLLYQGVEAFERWTGREAPVNAMNDTLRERL